MIKRTVLTLSFAGCASLLAAADIPLGEAEAFAVLAATTVTSTGPTVVDGSLGVAPGITITGFPPGVVVNGTIHTNDGVAVQAQADAQVAYTTLAGMAPTANLTGVDLGGLTLTPGVYFFASSAGLTGDLTLDGQNQTNPLFVFQIGSTLTTATASTVVMTNGADACNVFFQVGSSATLGTGTQFTGTIIALASNTLTTGTTVEGRVIALNGAVTLDTNNVTLSPACPAAPSCPATQNSTGAVVTLSYQGSLSIADNNFCLVATGLPPGAVGLFFFGVEEAVSPIGDGVLCVGQRIMRLQKAPILPNGTATYCIDFTTWPGRAIMPGVTYYFQMYYTDAAAGGAGYNTSDVLAVTFTP